MGVSWDELLDYICKLKIENEKLKNDLEAEKKKSSHYYEYYLLKIGSDNI